MAFIDGAVKTLWQVWKQVYETSPDPNARQSALTSLRTLDLYDDGHDNNSIDPSVNVWDIKDPVPSHTGTQLSEEEANRKFQTWWSQLPSQAQQMLRKEYAGDNHEFSMEEKQEAIGYIASKAGWEDDLTPEEIDTITDGLDDPDTTDETNEKYETWMMQLPPDVQEMIEFEFAGENGELSDDDRKEAVTYMGERAGWEDNLSEEDIESIRAGLDRPDTPEETNRKYEAWMKQLPEDVRARIEEKFAGSDGVMSDEEKKKAVEYMGALAGWDDELGEEGIAKILADLGKPKTAEETIRKFDAWMAQLPPDAQTMLRKRFGGTDKQLSGDEKKVAADYVASMAGWDDVLTPDEIASIRADLKNPAPTGQEANRKFDTWMALLPEDVRALIRKEFAGEDNEFSDEEKRKAVQYMGPRADWDDTLTREEIERMRAGLSKPVTTELTNRKFQTWWSRLPADVRDKLTRRFAGVNGEFSDEERKAAVDYLGAKIGWSDDVSNENLGKLRTDLGLVLTPQQTDAKFDEWMGQLPDEVKEYFRKKFAGANGVYSDEEKKAVVDYIAATVGLDGKLTQRDIDVLAADLRRPELGTAETTAKFDAWMNQLPPEIQSLLTDKFAGWDKKFSIEEKKRAVEYLSADLGWDDYVSKSEIYDLKSGLGLPTTEEETQDLYRSWFVQLPEDVRNRLSALYGGEDGELFGTEKAFAVRLIGQCADWKEVLTPADIQSLRLELGMV